MIHYTNTGNPIDFPKKKDIPMLERFAAQSLVEYDGELVFSKEKFAELIVRECADICMEMATKCAGLEGDGALAKDCAYWIKKDFGVEE